MKVSNENEQPLSADDFLRYWNEKSVARYLGVSVYFLQQDRVNKKRIPFVKLGSRVLYDPRDVREHLERIKQGGGS